VVGSKDYYAVLGVPRDATPDDIKHAFRKLASQLHPDRNPGDAQSEAQFKLVNEAYQTLSDEAKKAVYDFDQRMTGAGHTSPVVDIHIHPGGQNFYDVMNDLFKDTDFSPFRPPRRAASTQETFRKEVAGDNILMDLEITLEESVSGCKKPIIVKGPRPNVLCGTCNGIGTKPGSRRITCTTCAGHGRSINFNGRGNKPCSSCQGTGSVPLERCTACGGHGKVAYNKEITVQVPAGVSEGQQLRLAGQGTPGHPPGDLFITIKVSASKLFWREGSHLHTAKRISMRHAINGGPISLVGPDGSEINMSIPVGTQPGDIIRAPGAGVSGPLAKARGDLMVHIEVMLPRQLSIRARKLLDELMEELSRGPQGYT
jgi:molecular chaperone DnaJ